MFVLKNIGPIKTKNGLNHRFIIGKEIPEKVLKHWGKEGVAAFVKAKIIGEKPPEEEEPIKEESDDSDDGELDDDELDDDESDK